MVNASGEPIPATYRISESTGLPRHAHLAIDRLYRRVGVITGLGMNSSESLHVVHYGIGGHYDPHVDFFSVK